MKKVSLEAWYQPTQITMISFDGYYTEIHSKKQPTPKSPPTTKK